MQNNKKKYFFLLPIAILLVLPLVVMLLWNNVVISLFSIKAISYLQALGLFILCKILFGSFGFGNKAKPAFAKQFMKEKLMNLSDDEKCKLQKEWEKRNEKNENNLK